MKLTSVTGPSLYTFVLSARTPVVNASIGIARHSEKRFMMYSPVANRPLSADRRYAWELEAVRAISNIASPFARPKETGAIRRPCRFSFAMTSRSVAVVLRLVRPVHIDAEVGGLREGSQ